MEALVLFSGGQDSTTCLGWSLNRYPTQAIRFMYGQTHLIELEQATEICLSLGVKHHIIDVSFFAGIVDSALTSGGDVNKKHDRIKDLPASFVPNRNAFFITIAHALAQKLGIELLIGGMSQEDFSGYPDCREIFIDKMVKALNLGSSVDINIQTPLMFLSKAEIFYLAEREKILNMVLEDSHTCYNGNREKRYEWGYGCGECPACKLRAKGWDAYINFAG